MIYRLEQHPESAELVVLRVDLSSRDAKQRWFAALSTRVSPASHPLGDIRDYWTSIGIQQFAFRGAPIAGWQFLASDREKITDSMRVFFGEGDSPPQRPTKPSALEREPEVGLRRVELWHAIALVRREFERLAGESVWEPNAERFVPVVRSAFEAAGRLATAFEPSAYQEAVFDWALHWDGDETRRHAFVQAVAGSGKTTTIMQLAQRLAVLQAETGVMLAFNVSIASELRASLAKRGIDGFEASTMHALGVKLLQEAFPELGSPDQSKYNSLAFQVAQESTRHARYPTIKERGQKIAKKDMRATRMLANSIYEAFKFLSLNLTFPTREEALFLATRGARGSHPWAKVGERHGMSPGADLPYNTAREIQRTLADHGITAEDVTRRELPELEIGTLAARMFLYGMEEIDGDGSYTPALEYGHRTRAPKRRFALLDVEIAPSVFDYGARHKWVFVDEAQDLNRARLEFVRRLLDPSHGRLVAVGDRYQSVYGFTGADPHMVGRIVELFSAVELPLSVSYRCARAIATLANEILPSQSDGVTRFLAREGAPQGEVRWVSEGEGLRGHRCEQGGYRAGGDTLISAGDMIISPRNATVVKYAVSLLKAGCPVIVAGKDIDRSLVEVLRQADRLVKSDWARIDEGLATFRQLRETQLLRQLGAIEAKQPIADMQDRLDVLGTLLQLGREQGMSGSLDEATSFLFSFFTDVDAADETVRARSVLCSSIHRSKGLEAETVLYVLTDRDEADLDEAMHAVSRMGDDAPWQLVQRRNLHYVAVTRAKNRLIIERVEDRRE